MFVALDEETESAGQNARPVFTGIGRRTSAFRVRGLCRGSLREVEPVFFRNHQAYLSWMVRRDISQLLQQTSRRKSKRNGRAVCPLCLEPIRDQRFELRHRASTVRGLQSGGGPLDKQKYAVWFLPFALLLTGCGQSGEQEMQTCLSAAQRTQHAESSPDPSDLDEYVKECMETNGYRFSPIHFGCGHGDPYRDSRCYVQQ